MTPLNPNVPPSGNFDLLDWKITLPIDEDNNSRADEIGEIPLSEGFQDSRYFYTAEDGGMVFKAPIEGAKTSTNTKYTRTELREMLRQGNRAFSTKGVGGNNWVFSSAPSLTQDAAGGVDGELTATLAVNHVTTTGDPGQVGRVIIGQLHASDDEPLRIYYRKLPNNSTGSIYIAHQPRGSSSDQKYDMIGSRSRSAPDPGEEGIALNEKFSYKVNVVGDLLTVTIMRPGKPDVVQEVDMADSGYDDPNEYMYFKAGVYNLNNTGDPNDYVQATFYALDNEHTGYSNPTPVGVIPEDNTYEAPTLSLDTVNAINENGIATLTGTITDSDTSDTFTLDVNWGDPDSPNNTETFTFDSSDTGSQTFTLEHQYLDDNPSGTPSDYTINATVTDSNGGAGSYTETVDVNNVAPTITSVIAESVFIDDDNGIDDGDDDGDEGVLITVTGTFTDPGTLDIHTGTAEWSDGFSVDIDDIVLGDRTFTTSRFLSEEKLENNFSEVGDDVFQLGITTTIRDDDSGESEEFFLEFSISEEGEIV